MEDAVLSSESNEINFFIETLAMSIGFSVMKPMQQHPSFII